MVFGKDALDSVQAFAQNKVMIIDEKMVIAGSFNSLGRRKNAENLLIIQDALAAKYLENLAGTTVCWVRLTSAPSRPSS
jgi:phosphatidylserine/phosphatidylglycerophosphate/cardiolipin synthase-like enzyme